MATFLQNLKERAQQGLQNSIQSAVSDLEDENGNIMSVGVNVNVELDTKKTAIAVAIVLAAAVVYLLIKKGLKV